MKTEVIMKRELFGCEISQQSKSEFFSATDLFRAGNKWRAENGLSPINITDFLAKSSTKEFIASLEKTFGKVKISGNGRGSHTWVHPFLFIDMALAISPNLKIEVYSWLYDHLLKNRNNSGDSYNYMAGCLYEKIDNKRMFPKFMVETADWIRQACNVSDWQKANENQLELRDNIHKLIASFSKILPVTEARRLGIREALQMKRSIES